jgi:4a-hydroxytetrahydrobiopterin dehydratase
MTLLKNDEIKDGLSSLTGWNREGKQITKQFELKDIKTALSFVNKIGEKAEVIDHHPDIFIHSWNKVKITISTHSEGGLTKKDFQLAEKIQKLI